MAGIIIQNPANPAPHVPDATKAKLRDKAQQFESFYIYQFMELMSPKGNTSELSGGAGEDMFRHQLNEHMASNISKQGGFGLADAVYNQLLIQQEQFSATPESQAQ